MMHVKERAPEKTDNRFNWLKGLLAVLQDRFIKVMSESPPLLKYLLDVCAALFYTDLKS